MARKYFERTADKNISVVNMETGTTTAPPAIPVVCERIKHFREIRNMEQKELARLTGVTGNAISNWETGRARPDINLIPAICSALDITLYDLYAMDNPYKPYNKDEDNLISLYRNLTLPNRMVTKNLMTSLKEAQAASRVTEMKRFLIFSKPLAAGIGDPAEFEGTGKTVYLYTGNGEHRYNIEKSSFIFTINGDSMEPEYKNGDMVLVQKTTDKTELAKGDIGAFIVGNEMYIKAWYPDGLHSLNPKYAPLRFAEPVYIIGKVIGKVDTEDFATAEDIDKYERMTGVKS